MHQPSRLNLFRISLFLGYLLCLLGMSRWAQADETPADTTYIQTQPAQVIQKIAPDMAERQAIAQQTDQTLPSMNASALQQISTVASSHPAQHPEIATAGDILIFISFSMPETSLRQWAEQAKRFHASLIVRGLINGSFAQTQSNIAKLFGEDNGGVVLEPRLFSDYQITQVPAVVVRDTTMICPITQNCPHVYPFDVVTGDIGLEDTLAVIARQDGAATEVAKSALHTGRGSR